MAATLLALLPNSPATQFPPYSSFYPQMFFPFILSIFGGIGFCLCNVLDGFTFWLVCCPVQLFSNTSRLIFYVALILFVKGL